MSSDTVISVQGVSKRYRIFDSSWVRLRCALSPSPASHAREVWALRDVSFEVKRGEAVGIIGRNGSGKSTLLELIAGTLKPTEGVVEVPGRVAALLELGSGFNPECTGRENVFLNGLLLGLTRTEIKERFDDIAGFADIGDVLNLPVKTYSTGMLVRLAFSVQVALEPEILIVDEALSVGDFFFQQKCFGHLRRMRERGLTLLFVSHDMGTVRNLCQKSLYLRKGRAEYWGEGKTAIQRYMNEQHEEVAPDAKTMAQGGLASLPELDALLCKALWRRDMHSALNENLRIFGVALLDKDGVPTTSVAVGETVCIRTYFRTIGDERVHISFSLKNRYDQIIFNTSSYILGLDSIAVTRGHFCTFELEITCAIEAGEYSMQISLGRPVAANRGECVEASDWFGTLQVQWDYEQQRAPFLGMFGLPTTGRIM